MKLIANLWAVLLPLLTFVLTVLLAVTLTAKDRKVIRAILKAGDITLSEAELQRRRDGKLVGFIAGLIPKVEGVIDLQKLFGYDLRNMLRLMGDKRTPERVYADHIATALLVSSTFLLLCIFTGFWGYIAFFPVSFFFIMMGQAQMVRRRYKNWQNEVIKDIPELIDKMRISLASGKDYISALKKVQDNSGLRLRSILERLITDMQIMRPTQALDEFAKAFGMPVMVKFVAAIKVGIEVGYDQAENYFIHIEEDIRELRRLSLEELTKSKPEKVHLLKALMIGHALAALGLTAYNLLAGVRKIF